MKRQILALWLVFLCLAGCAAQDFHMVGDADYPDYRIFEFRAYSDTFSHSLALNAGDTVALDVIVRQGTLKISVKTGDNTVVYQNDAAVSGNQEVKIDTDGSYCFTFTTVNASGNVTMTALRAPKQEETEPSESEETAPSESEETEPSESEETKPSKSEEPSEPSDPEPTAEGGAPMLALTFDDGPSQYTKEILDLLETYNAKATFFVVGTNADNYDVTMSRALSLGCEIGNHTVNHLDLTDADSETIAKEISSCAESVQCGTGYTPPFLRPPYGAVNQSVKEQVGMPMILWSVDTRDWESRDADAVIAQVLGKVSDGDIILMHDLYGSTAEACKTIIPKLIEEGYQLVTVSELARAKGIDLEAGVCYYSFHE